MLQSRCLFAFNKTTFNTITRLKPIDVPPRWKVSNSLRFSTEASKIKSNPNTGDGSIEKIYSGPLTTQIKAVKAFSLTTSFAGIIGQPIIYNQATSFGSAAIVVAACGVVGFFTFVTPVLLHFITRRYVTTIDYDKSSDSYVATLLTFFLRQKKVEFTTKDITVPDVPGMFSTFTVNKTPIFVDYRQFKDPNHYVKMMGYDKPLDLQLSKLTSEEFTDPKK